jgi:hypothetical protein
MLVGEQASRFPMPGTPSIGGMRHTFSHDEEPSAAIPPVADAPQANVVVNEIGILLAVHLAIALTVCLVVGAS